MKQRSIFLGMFLLFSFVPCFAHHLALIVNKDNPIENVSSAELSRIFRSEVSKWPNGNDVVLVIHRNADEEKLTLEHLNRMSASELDAIFAAHRKAILIVDSDEQMLSTVEANPGAVGLVSAHTINDRVRVVKVGGKLPMEQGYLPH
jgi:phosphate transport system substrate-binding protein